MNKLGEYIKSWPGSLLLQFLLFCRKIHNFSSKSSSDSTFCASETRPYSTRSPKQRICWWEENAGYVFISDGNDGKERDDDVGDDDENKHDNDDDADDGDGDGDINVTEPLDLDRQSTNQSYDYD